MSIKRKNLERPLTKQKREKLINDAKKTHPQLIVIAAGES